MTGIARALGRFVFGKLLPRGLPLPVLRGPLRGMRFILGAAAGEGGGASVYFNLVEPDQTRRIVEALRPRQVFFDVGANVGYYSLIASRVVGAEGRVVCFEPFLENVNHLYRHVNLNRLHNVDVLPVACSSGVGMTNFFRGDNDALGHISGVNGDSSSDNDPAGDAYWVLTLSLDEFALRTGRWPAIIKIDVEGAELLVLQGAERILERCRPTIFLSTHGDDVRRLCLAFLEERGFAASPLNAAQLDAASEFVVRPNLGGA
jgi:FkbM family methyltransferase